MRQPAKSSVLRVATAMLKKAADDERWFAGQLEDALRILKDAVDVADAPGGLSDSNSAVAKAVGDIRLNISRDLSKHAKAVKRGRRAKQASILAVSDDVEVIYDPFRGSVEIGMGGEWWGGPVKLGKNVYRHRKERVDEAYKPVTVHVAQVGHAYRFAVGGGFGMGTTVMLGFK